MPNLYSTTRPGRAGQLARLLLLCTTLLMAPGAWAQAPPAWNMVTPLNLSAPSSAAEVRAVAFGSGGEVYVAGSFRGSMQLGANQLVSAGGTDAFVAKWSPATRGFVWGQRLGGAGNEQVNALAVSGGNVYVAGIFASPSIRVDQILLGNNSLNGNHDLFVAKLTDIGLTGEFNWATSAGDHGDDQATALVVNGLDVYVAGYFYCPRLVIGGVPIFNMDGSGFSADVFVAKLSDNGRSFTCRWGQRGGGLGDEFAYGVAANGTDVYLAGAFSSLQPQFGTTTLANADTRGFTTDAFVARLGETSTGADFNWAWQAGTTGTDRATAVTIGATGAYAAGGFSGRVRFGNTTLTTSGGIDAFLVKLSNGVQWVQSAGNSIDDTPTTVAASGSKVYVAGLSGVYRFADAGSSGSLDWQQPAPQACLALGNGHVYVGGSATSSVSMGGYTLAGSPTSPIGYLAGLPDAAVLSAGRPGALPGLRLVPNPAREQLRITLPTGMPPEVVRITDVRGVTVALIESQPGTVDVAGLAPGLYLVTATAGPHRYQQKLLKQ